MSRASFQCAARSGPVFDLKQLLETAVRGATGFGAVVRCIEIAKSDCALARVEDICSVARRICGRVRKTTRACGAMTADFVQVLDLDILLDESGTRRIPG